MQVLDADAHVEESLATFADPWWDAAYAVQRPYVVPRGADAAWVIEDRLLPKLHGSGVQFFLSPASIDGRPTAASVRKAERNGDVLGSAELSDVDARLQQMDAEGLHLQVLYPTLFLAHPLAEDVGLGNALARSYNSWLAAVCGRRPDRLKWVCVVNLDDVAGACAELRRCRRELGAVGVMILGTAGDRKLDHPTIEPFWAEAEALDLAVAVHIGWPSPSLQRIFDSIYDSQTVALYTSLFIGFVDIVAGGVLDRHPRLRVAFLEAGTDWLPFWLGRMAHRAGEVGAYYGYAARRQPREYLRGGQLYFGCEIDDQLLPQMAELVGPEYLLFASDIPHADREKNAAAELLARPDLPSATKQLILGENTARFYGL